MVEIMGLCSGSVMPSRVKTILAVLAIWVIVGWGMVIAIPAAQALSFNGQPLQIAIGSIPAQESDHVLQEAFDRQQSDLQVEGQGRVSRILSDDLEGSRHQRFIVRLQSGQTVLIAHNIDLAPRVASIREGDEVRFFGEYEWNQQGGVIHWTHKDPNQQHVDGWIEHRGQRYE